MSHRGRGSGKGRLKTSPATYLAVEDLIGNFDDIDGPGNNSFLRWDEDTQQMTVVACDHNLAFGVVNGGVPEGGAPAGARPLVDTAGGPGGSNVLSEQFLATAEFVELYDTSVERLQAELFDDGTAQGVLDSWTAVLSDQASDLVDASTVETDAQQVASYFDGHVAEQ